MDRNKNNKGFLKCFLVSMIIVILIFLIYVSETLAQWPSYSNTGWPSQTFTGSSLFSFNPIYSYIGSFNNSFSMPYGSNSSPGLYSFQGLRYANQYTGIYPGLINYNNYTSGTSYAPFPAVTNFSSTLNPYIGLLSPGSRNISYTWQNAPLFSTPYYSSAPSVVNVTANTGWPIINYSLYNYVWNPYPTSITTSNIENEEYRVYSALIEELDSDIHIWHQTLSWDFEDNYPSDSYCSQLIESMEGLERETIDNFMEKNERQYTLKDNFTIDGDYEIVDQTYEPNDDEKDVPHQLIKLSRVGFNSDKNQALVHVSIGPYHTYKFYLRFYFLIKEDGAWKVESMYTTGSYLIGG